MLMGIIEQATQAAAQATERALHDPIIAHIRPGTKAGWYVVVVLPGHENVASGHLIGRRFGVFDPFGMVTVVMRGRKRTKHQRLLPGYLLVFAWDIEDQKDRIRNCPGVVDILKRPDGSAADVPDVLVDYLQGKEIARSADVMDLARSLGIDPATPIPVVRAKAAKSKKDKKKRYKNKKQKKAEAAAAPAAPVSPPLPPVEIVTIRPYSALDGIEALDDDGRVSLFNRALGVGSQHLPNGT